MGMTIRSSLGLLLVLCLCTIPVSAAPLHTAKVGDQIGVLTNGLDSFDLGPAQLCGQVAEIYGYAKHGLEHTMVNASALGAAFNGNLRIIVTYDEQDLNLAVSMYVGDQAGTILGVFAMPPTPDQQTFVCQKALQ